MGSAKIMIVEDNTTVAEDCRDCLEALHYEVTSVVASGEEAIENAGTERPDATLMDIHLRDEMDGIEAARQIYARYEIPVVFLSAYGDPELLERAKQVGSFGYLIKPFEDRELQAMLEMALYKSKSEKERRQLEARLQKAQKLEAIGTMAGGIAHRFNNILSTSMGYIEMGLEDIRMESPAYQSIVKALAATHRASELVRKIMRFSNYDDSVLKIIKPAELLHTFLDADTSASSTEIAIDQKIAPETWPILFDGNQFTTILTNLFANAVDAMKGRKGVLTIGLKNITIKAEDLGEHDQVQPGPFIQLTISDTGTGIAKEKMERIFDPFYTTKTVGEGDGIGLTIVQALVIQRGGIIQVESEAAKGSEFRVLLPVVE